MLLQGRTAAVEKEAPPQATHGAAQTFPPWGPSWEMALELPGKAFQGQGLLKDTGLFRFFPQCSDMRKPANGDLCLGALASCV